MAKQLTIDLRTILFIVIEILLIYNYITFPSFFTSPNKHPPTFPSLGCPFHKPRLRASHKETSIHPKNEQSTEKVLIPLLRLAW